MTRPLCFFVALCTSGLVACAEGTNPEGEKTIIKLTTNQDGKLVHQDPDQCPADAPCPELENPENCRFLTLSVDNLSGEACERCEDEAGNIIFDRCEQTEIDCTVVTAPEPDCVVCAVIGGAVVHSTCIPEDRVTCEYYTFAPDRDASSEDGLPPGGSDAAPIDEEGCQICTDPAGNVVSDTCGNTCLDIACPQILCQEGFRPYRYPGECCDVCVPVDNCDNVMCPQPIAACPDGTRPVRDPSDCCNYHCEPIACDNVLCFAEVQCPPGYHVSKVFPDCCGTCVPDPTDYCFSSEECPTDTICTVDEGQCLPLPGCALSGTPTDPATGQDPATGETSSTAGDPSTAPDGIVCPDVCVGVCRPKDHNCDDIQPANGSDPQTSASFAPPPEFCEGEWSGGVDPQGCSLPPVCVCFDGTISLDGRCENICALLDINCPAIDCAPGYHLEFTAGDCCGTCVPDVACLTYDATGQAQESDPNIVCPVVDCIPGSSPAQNPETCCWDRCEPDPTACTEDGQCEPGQICSTRFQDCFFVEPDPATGSPICLGICIDQPDACQTDDQCLPGDQCVNGECVPNRVCFRNEDCTATEQCTIAEDCQEPVPCSDASGDECDPATLLPVCVGVCEPRIIDGFCNTDNDCTDGVCRDGICDGTSPQ